MQPISLTTYDAAPRVNVQIEWLQGPVPSMLVLPGAISRSAFSVTKRGLFHERYRTFPAGPVSLTMRTLSASQRDGTRGLPVPALLMMPQ